MSTLELDGRTVEIRTGETILAVARRAGVDIPTLCHVDGLPPEGGCRLCLVEIEGQTKPRAACHTHAAAGMSIRTQSPALQTLRHDVLALNLARCAPEKLETLARDSVLASWMERLGLDGPELGSHHVDRRHDESHTYLRFDAGLCVGCRRCMAACEHIQGQFVYGIAGRGGEGRLIFGPGERFELSACVACGACVELCPSGALTDLDRVGAPPAESVTESVCGYCGVGCRVRVSAGEGRVLRIQGVPDASVNHGHLCAKGRYAHAYRESKERLTRPLLRRGGELVPVSWQEAFAFASRRLTEIVAARGPSALGVLTSSRSTNEAAYLFQKIFRVLLGTNNIDCCARVCHSSTALALQQTTGTGAATTSYDDIESARLIVVAGANPTEAHPVIGARLKQAALRGVPMIVIDPRAIELARYATLHLALRPGTNVALFNALAKALDEAGGVDEAYAAERLEGLGALRQFLASTSLEEASEISGVGIEAIRRAAGLLAGGPVLFVHGLGLSELTQGVGSVKALTNLGMLTGSIGKPGAGMMPLRGQNNVQGNADMGSMPNQVTGYQPLSDPSVRERCREVWGAAAPEAPGLTVTEMLEAAREKRLAALWIQGEDVAQSDPREDHVVEALESLELLVVQELFMTETARRAHLVLPAAAVLEQEGTFTNAERRIQHVRPALPPPGEARPDWEIALDLARVLGADWSYASPAAVMDEVARVAPALFGGVSYARLEGDGLQWPCPAQQHPGTSRVHEQGFLAGRGKLSVVRFVPSPEHDVHGFPFQLITGRVLHQYNVGTMTRRTPASRLAPEDWLEVNPSDLDRLHLRDGDRVRVESRWGSVAVHAQASRRVAPGTLFLSFHHPETHANRLIGPHRDPESKCPDYKVVAARLANA